MRICENIGIWHPECSHLTCLRRRKRICPHDGQRCRAVNQEAFTMPRSKHSGRSGKRRVVLSKNALLPLSQARINDISLGYHLALAACAGPDGTSHLMNELTRAVYLTFYLGEWATCRCRPIFTAWRRRVSKQPSRAPTKKARGNSSRLPWRRWKWFFRFTTRNLRPRVREIWSRLNAGWPVSS